MVGITEREMVSGVQETTLLYGESVFSAASALLEKETQQLSDRELVAILFGINQTDAQAWLRQSGSLRKLVESSAMGKALMEFASRYLLEKAKRGVTLEDPGAVRLYLKAKLRERPSEVFAVTFLDNRHRVIVYEEMFFGTINGANVYPREVVKAALKHNAAAVILAHNHPSGVAEPSQSDEHITRRLREALALVDVRVLDHFVVGDEIVSFAERGLL